MTIVLFTDFGTADIYVGQVKAVLHAEAPGTPVIDLSNDLTPYCVPAAAALLAAFWPRFPRETIFLAVVDPGVGSARDAVVVQADGRWLIGPDNGLLSVCVARAVDAQYWSIRYRPDALSVSFHGRDVFAPVAARLACGVALETFLSTKAALDVTLGGGDRAEIIYLDHYGNAVTGLRAAGLRESQTLNVAGTRLPHARVYSAVKTGEMFWYENSLGLAEIAVSGGSAAGILGLRVGHPVAIEEEVAY
jgi:S-adenosyl-L-methionine hydrolase (adenosine-forming)